MTISFRVEVGRSLAARLAALLPGQSSPLVTQSQLVDLVKTDRSDDQLAAAFLCGSDGVGHHRRDPLPGEADDLVE